MADAVATNKFDGNTLYWLDIDNDTPVVYAYDCSVDDHVVLASVRLASGTGDICPVHHVTLDNETAITVATSP